MTDNKAAYVSSVSFSAWGADSAGSGHINLRHGSASTTFELDADDVSELKTLATKIIDKHKKVFAAAINQIDTTPQLTYDSSKTIDADEIQF